MNGFINIVDKIVWVLLIIGGLNWGLVGFFHYDFVAHLFGEGTMYTRIVYDIVGVAAIYGIFSCYKYCNK